MENLQGNSSKDNPNKYGLKFDQGKARWYLVPFPQLMQIIGSITNPVYRNLLLTFNPLKSYNEVLTCFSKYVTTSQSENLIQAALEIFMILRGKPYTEEELQATDSIYRWDLFNAMDLQGVVNIYTYGAELYSENNWKKVSKERYIGAFYRHFIKIQSKERFDGESGFLHLYHALWNIIALLWIGDEDDLCGKKPT